MLIGADPRFIISIYSSPTSTLPSAFQSLLGLGKNSFNTKVAMAVVGVRVMVGVLVGVRVGVRVGVAPPPEETVCVRDGVYDGVNVTVDIQFACPGVPLIADPLRSCAKTVALLNVAQADEESANVPMRSML